MSRVLVIDDELSVRDYLSSILTEQGFETHVLENGENIQTSLSDLQPDILLLDYKMPGCQSGVDVVKQVRGLVEFRNLPIIMVTGVDTEVEKVQALEVGADDYIVKPCLPKELGARIKAVLRRTRESENIERLETDGLVVDLKSHKVVLQGKEVYLTLTEFKILSELLKQKGSVLSRDKLRETALGNLNVTDRTIDVHMASLRKKLDEHAPSIQTVRGVGYRYAN